MSSISATLTVRTVGTGIPVPPPTITPPPTTVPPPTPTPTPPAPVVEPLIPVGITSGTPKVSLLTTQPGQKTLLLDTARWDIVTDAAGNIAVAGPPYAMAQDAASAVRLFRGELWYDTSKGVPYFQQILGKQPPIGTLKSALTTAALTVPYITSAQTFISSITGRNVIGQIQLITTGGTTVVVTGTLQAMPLTDSASNPMTDSAGNLMFTVM